MTELREINELEKDVATAYKVLDADRPAFDCVNAVKSHHAEQVGCEYSDLTARKVAENKRNGHFVVAVVNWSVIND